MIPKIIHYCWFGPKEMPADQRKYVEVWKYLMPDYEFKCWNENTINIDSFSFAKGAYDARKYAYVADYVRIYALCHEGGIYMDTDILLKKRLDEYLKFGMFTSYECAPARKDMSQVRAMLTSDGERVKKGVCTRIPGIGLFSALIGCEANHPFIVDVLQYYDNHSFDEVWNVNLTVPNILAFHAEKYGFKYKNEEQHINENIVIFDYSVFASKLHANRRSVAIHYCAASWKNLSLKNKIKGYLYDMRLIRLIINKLFPKY